jgi:hypothetical protein
MIRMIAPVNFDVNNKKHREAFHIFLKDNTWSKTRTRFILEHPFVDIPSMIHNKLLNYYLTKEFNKEKA